MSDYTILPTGFTFERPAVLDADPDMDFTVATVRGIGVEYRHTACGYGDAEVVTVVPDMGRPSYRTFPTWVEAHDYVCDTARREVLAEMGHDFGQTEASCPGGRHADYVAAGVTCASCGR